jgi:endonuclease YncB( thermonuclease family)
MNFSRIIPIAVIIFFIISATNPKKINIPQEKSQKKYQVISGFAQIIDGDSLKINNVDIRLVGIDAPEYKQKCFDKNIKKYQCGLESMNFLKNLIAKQKVSCKYYKKDIYDRALGKCEVNNFNLNHGMVLEGWAILYNFSNSTQEMKNLEILAKKNKKGMWQGSFLEPKKYRKRNF